MTQKRVEAPPISCDFDTIYLGGEVCKWLYVMKGRLHMEDGVICRLAICLSLGERFAPDLSLTDQEGGKLFPIASLVGPSRISTLLFAFLRQRMLDDGLDPHNKAEMEQQFRAHLSRGMLLLGVRVKHLDDIGRLVQDAHERFRQSHQEEAIDPTQVDKAEQGAPGTQVGILSPEIGRLRPAIEAAPITPQPQLDGETRQKVAAVADSLWGTLLPEPVKTVGMSRDARKKRGVPSARKKHRRHR